MTDSLIKSDLVDLGFVLKHTYTLDYICPYCAGRLQRQEWGKAHTSTVGLDTCRCGYTSQQHCIA